MQAVEKGADVRGVAQGFVRRLSELSMPGVFNPWSDVCPYHDLPDGPAIRRRNLELVLGAALAAPSVSLWVAQDLGRKGGRRTGLALTDEVNFDTLEGHWGVSGLCRATSGDAMPEATAGYVWKALSARNEMAFLWNVFPLQPYPPDAPLRNRGHTRQEAALTAWALDWILDALAPARVVALGRFAEQRLADRGVPCVSVRHPGRGGGPLFLRQMQD